MSWLLRSLARTGAYGITLLLAAVWTVGALHTFIQPFYDIGRPAAGDAIMGLAGLLNLTPAVIMRFAQLLAGLKFMVGGLLLVALFGAAYEKLRWGSSDGAVLDVALLTSAIASAASLLPGLIHGGEPLLSVIGELMLCVIASGLAVYGRGFLVRPELPAPVRPAFGYSRAA